MNYYVLNDGLTSACPRTAIKPGVTERLSFLIRNGGVLPRPFDQFRVEVAHADGGALFTLWREKQPLTISGLAWTENGAAEIWGYLERIYYDLSDTHPAWMSAAHAATRPAKLPWLGLVYLPAFPLTGGGQIGWFGDFAHCLGWTIALEREPGLGGNRTSSRCNSVASYPKLKPAPTRGSSASTETS
jgi:hypothetical protein